MKLILFVLLVIILNLTTAENDIARKKGGHKHGLHGILYHHGIISLVTFLAIKAKIIIAAVVAFTVFTLGAKVWATYKYGNIIFDKGHHDLHHEVYHPPPTHYGGDYFIPHEYEASPPSYAFEKYHE
ncbi:hypothetical protein CBL_12689 [Carabus blaptoides fortunei]